MWVYDQTCRTCTKTSGSQSGKLTRGDGGFCPPETRKPSQSHGAALLPPFPVGVKCKEWHRKGTESRISI